MATGPVFTATRPLAVWAAWVIFALLLMPIVGQWQWWYLACVVGTALLLSLLRAGPAGPDRAGSS